MFNNLGEASSQGLTGQLFKMRNYISDPYMSGVVVSAISLLTFTIFRNFDLKFDPYLIWEREQDVKTSVEISKNEEAIDPMVNISSVQKYTFEVEANSSKIEEGSGLQDNTLLDESSETSGLGVYSEGGEDALEVDES